MKTTLLLIAAMIAANAIATAAHADEFMDADTHRARMTEANGECRINQQLGADFQGCVSAYLCSNYGECEGEGMKPLEPTPWGVYRDTNGGTSNG